MRAVTERGTYGTEWPLSGRAWEKNPEALLYTWSVTITTGMRAGAGTGNGTDTDQVAVAQTLIRHRHKHCAGLFSMTSNFPDTSRNCEHSTKRNCRHRYGLSHLLEPGLNQEGTLSTGQVPPT